MGFLDFEKVIHLEPEEITEEEKENLYADIITFEVRTEVEAKDAVKLFQITQEILKYKGEQVESLILELDNLAAKLGEEEAKRSQNYVDETDLRISEADKGNKNDTDDYHRKLVKIEIQNNRLIDELQEKEQELMNEKKELEKLTNRISVLEEENKALRSELQATQQELASNASLKSLADDQDYPSMEKYHELTELLRQKNRHITQLLNDIEDTEKENIALKDQLAVVRDELAEGADQMSKLSMERLSLSTCVDELKYNVLKLEQENAGLRNQISELVVDKEKRDLQFENMSAGYESKIQQWKDMLQKKDTELTALRLQYSSNTANGMFDDTDHLAYLSDLSKTLAEREEKIMELQQQLEQATIDLNESTRLLEEQRELYKRKFDKNAESGLVKQLRKKLEQTENRVAVLEAKARHAEEDSLRKAEEVTELIIQLREYESGTYGLEEAMIRIKELQKQRQVRDTQIEQLVQNSNQLQDDVNFLEQENQILRDRLGISQSEQIVVEDFSRRNRDRHNKLSELVEQLEKCQDELLSYRLENRNLSKQVSSLQADVNFYRLKESTSVDSDDNQQSSEPGMVTRYTKNLSVAVQSSLDEEFLNMNTSLEDRFTDIVDENESLRKGMHEILDSIRNRDSSGTIQIESETLERLLEALDSRHVTGWYQPAMRLQAYIHNLSGVNKTLRGELHVYRQREEELLYELHEASQKLEQVRGAPQTFKPVTPATVQERKVFSPKLKKSVSCEEDVLKSSHQVHQIEKKLKDEEQKRKKLEKEIEQLQEKFTIVEEEATKLHEQYETDKESWFKVKTAMQKEIDDVKNNEQMLLVKNAEYEKSLDVLKQSPEDIKKAFAESTFGITTLKVEQMQLSRKFQALLEVENQVRQERNKLSDEVYSLKVSKDREIVELRKTVEQLSSELKTQLMTLSECVNRYDHSKVVNDFNELTVKHREMLHKQILLQSEKDQVILKMQNEVASLLSQKAELEVSLKLATEENKYLKCVTSDVPAPDQVTALTKQLASLEVEIINKKQYSDHLNRMYELTKEQFTETENRCKNLENQLILSVQTNSELQRNETMLKERLLKLPNIVEFEELVKKLKETENEAGLLRSQKTELEELANIAQDQVKALEQYNRYQDFEYDSLQRRILELQSLSDEKMVIDRLTKELLLLQQNGINANEETNNFKDKLAKSENEMLQAKLKLSVCENNYNKLKRDSNLKMRCMCSILYELQKRYLGSFPLVKEELCFESLLQSKDECYTLTSLLLELKPPSIAHVDESENDQSEYIGRGAKDGKYKSKFKIQDFNMRLINEGLQNKIQIYAERLERQDKLISRLEQEIVHADEQCQEFLLYWSPHSGLKLNGENEDAPNSKFTQTFDKEAKFREEVVEHSVAVPVGEPSDELNQTNKTLEELHQKLKSTEDELRSTRDRLANLMMELKEKELMISNKDREILNLQRIGYERGSPDESVESNNDENSIKRLALKATVDSLQNIINQKEEIIKRLQTLMKKNGEEHAQSVVQLLRELKVLQDAVDAKDQACNRLKARLDALEKPPNEKRTIIDSYLTKIHELEDELSQSNEKIEQLSNQLTASNQKAELWSHTAEERLKTLQNMKHELDTKHGPSMTASATNDANKISYSSLLQLVKEKSEEMERQNQYIEELKKRLGSGEKLPGYRDRLKNELERHKRKVELLEQREREDKAEIQRLKNQILTRPQSARKKDALVTPKEEQLLKKIKILEEQIEAYTEKEKKWTENRRTKIDSEVEKWQNKKRYQQNQDKLREQLKETTVQNESLKIINDRLKETVMRLEKERMALDSKLKAAKSQTASMSLIEELQKTNSRLEDEVKVLRNSVELSTGATSLTDVIEAQERKIKVLEMAQKGDCALAEEVERLDERKSQLQKYNMHLEEVNMRLKLELERLKSHSKSTDELLDLSTQVRKTDVKSYSEEIENQLKGNRRKNIDLEKAVLVLRRVIEKLQAENKRLHGSKVAQLQDKNYVEKLQIELQNLQENYLDAIEKASVLDKELKNAHEKIDSLQKLIDRLQNGEEVTVLKSQLAQKNRLLSKVKILLEKAAVREKELIEKVNDLQAIGPSY